MLRELRIGSLTVYPNLVLAPMADVTDSFFRQLVKEFGGCGLTVSELISVEGLARGQSRTMEMLDFHDAERPFGVQLYGCRPENMAIAARMAQESGADFVDINAGCPARKVVRSRGGSSLLREPETLEKILRAVRPVLDIPLTLKFRSGFSDSSLNFLEIGRMAEDCGVDALTLHPRTREQMFTGLSNWDHIRQLKEAVRIPVIGNGDILHPEDAERMFRETGCDAVMIGRGIMKNPWLIRQCHDHLSSGSFNPTTPLQSLELCRLLAGRYASMESDRTALGQMKKVSSWLVHGFRGAAEERQRLFHMTSPHALLDHLDSLLELIRLDHPAQGS